MRLFGSVGAAIVLAALPIPAAHAASLRFAQDFTSRVPGSSTGVHGEIVYPDGSPGKPKSVRAETIEFPEGTVIDLAAAPECLASDLELQAVGLGACPSETILGEGPGTAVTGFGPPIDPVTGDGHLINGRDEILSATSPSGSDRVLTVDHLKVRGNRVVDESPASAPGGPPDGKTAVKKFDLRVPARARTVGGAAHRLFTTPPTCPRDGAWVSHLAVTFDDGSTEVATATTPCDAALTPRKPSMHLSVTPRRTRTNVATRFSFRVVSDAGSCRKGVKVSLAGRRARTDRDGSAAIIAKIERRGRLRARATARGCKGATARVTVSRSRV